MNPDLYIITGGPGAGKTCLLAELEKRGFRCVPEVARPIIREQLQEGGTALPWGDKELYKAIMFGRSIDDFIRVSSAATNNIIFFDRGIIDTIGYARLEGLEVTAEMDRQARQYRYKQKLFILPFWEEIYTTDTERKQSVEEAKETYRVLRATYEDYGYIPVEVPKAAVEERAGFILRQIDETKR